MPLSPIRLRLSVAVLCFAAVALAQQPYNWVNNPPPVEVFAPSFEKVWAASYEKPAFQSIKGRLIPEDGTWSTLAPLLGMSRCWLRELPTPDGVKLLLHAHTVDVPYWVYECRLEAGIGATKGYSNLVKAVEKSRQDWQISPNGGRSVEFGLGDEERMTTLREDRKIFMTSRGNVSVKNSGVSVEIRIKREICTEPLCNHSVR